MNSPPGVERISIARWLDAEYDVLVHDYSATPGFPRGDVTVRIIETGGIDRGVFDPHEGVGRWWHVCRVNGSSGRIEEVNTVQEDCPCPVTIGAMNGVSRPLRPPTPPTRLT
jgi:hypothetical protein